MRLSRYEQETIINFNEEEKTAGILHPQQDTASEAGSTGAGQTGGLQARQSVPQRTGS